MKKQIIFGSIALGLLLPVSALAHSNEHSNLSATLDARRSSVQSTQGIDTAIAASTKHDDDDDNSISHSNRGRHEGNEMEDEDMDDDDAVVAPVTTPVDTTTPPAVTTPADTTTTPAVVAPVSVHGTVVDPANSHNRVRFSFQGTVDQIKSFLASIAAALHLV